VPIWGTGTDDGSNSDPNLRGARFSIQSDGNVVLYNASNRPIWATATYGNPGARFAIQNDGNLVVYKGAIPGTPIWASGTNGRVTRTFSAAREWLSQYNSPPSSSAWKMPWRSGITPKISQGWHYDAWMQKQNALDIGLNAGVPVLAPANSSVVSFCNARSGGSHLSILLQTDNGQYYTLTHVSSNGVYTGKKYRQGEQLGVVASDTPWNGCAQSSAPHLHFGLPSQSMNIDGNNIQPQSLPGSLQSTNQ
jgi:murein DD-endopeptidase MepM/ murein hydrolase activator NlpD